MQHEQYSFHLSHLHAVPGSLRLNIPAVRACRRTALEVASMLERQPGVHSVNANPRSGNVLVSFDETVRSHADLIAMLVREGLIETHVHPDA